ncbi:unnamed protein product [Orchesella dallaii]|uniref:Uncharacterized protein n=1 Tax=Orchesella dallaii TaxID=48710 RepID=A0ABP1Q331_9HEXA
MKMIQRKTYERQIECDDVEDFVRKRDARRKNGGEKIRKALVTRAKPRPRASYLDNWHIDMV